MTKHVVQPRGSFSAPWSLEDNIRRCLFKSAFDTGVRKFLPEGMLEKLITMKAIEAAFRRVAATAPEGSKPNDTDTRVLAEHILDKSKRLFATVVMVGLKDYSLYLGMLKLKQAGFDDTDLPISREKFVEGGLITSAGNVTIELDHDNPSSHDESSSDEDSSSGDNGISDVDGDIWSDSRIDEFGDMDEDVWSDSRVDEFCDQRQWHFLSPVFSETDPLHHLSSSCIVPITEVSHVIAEGASAVVSKMKIHPSHLLIQGHRGFQKPHPVAVKTMILRGAAERRNIEKTWEKETRALLDMNMLNQPHIVRFHSAFTRGPPAKQERCLIIELATGGNLRDLWKSFYRPSLTAELVKATYDQLLGLVQAIHEAHYPKSGPNFRHSDLKPENVLWFKNKDSKDALLGTLKIGDWGLAKQHFVVTEMRSNRTRSGKGTRRYEPPEEIDTSGRSSLSVKDRVGMKRSRLYDVWALGCIMLEFLIWLMYGREGLLHFNNSLGTADYVRFFQIKPAPGGGTMATVHDVVARWMAHMAEDDACRVGTTALGNLLELVRTRLLVVKLPERLGTVTDLSQGGSLPRAINSSIPRSTDPVSTSQMSVAPSHSNVPSIMVTKQEAETHESEHLLTKEVSFGPERARSDLVLRFMLTNAGDDETEAYWDPGSPKRRKGPDIFDVLEEVQKHVFLQSKLLTGTDQIDGDWLYLADNDFAGAVVSSIASSSHPFPHHPVTSKLCAQCQSLREHILKSAHSEPYKWKELKRNAKAESCDLCVMLYAAWKSEPRTDSIRVERDGSSISINGKEQMLSIFRSPDLNKEIDENIQIGYPDLTVNLKRSQGENYFEILKEWLKDCDKNHCDRENGDKCGRTHPNPDRGSLASSTASRHLPTRVIAVGGKEDPMVRLLETGLDEQGEWIALSHQWGTGKKFRTTTENLKSHIKGISFASLPATFRDAVQVTRALGCKYLWIDSICIVQEGHQADFETEKKNMEQVYSGAYCVLASSRNPGHYAGFLDDRNPRPTLSLQKSGQSAPFYITKPIDNFNDHVLEGSLNKRGWVLQEHALARRTIYFTDHQTYYECGDGVRCETMTKMTSDFANFLGDPGFSQIIRNADRGERIIRYQTLFRSYSLLGLTNTTDRPLAIGSLQHRIQDSLDADGGFGVFDEGSRGDGRAGLLRRSLLWRRHGNTPTMSRIVFLDGQVVPSWSWMAHAGGIDYISPKFGGMTWKPLRSPWSSNLKGRDNSFPTGVVNNDTALVGEASDYDAGRARQGEGEIIFDIPPGEGLQPLPTKCVVLGIERGLPEPKLEHRLHYVLVIRATKSSGLTGMPVYERVGAGWLPGRCILGDCGRVVIH
ncbi:hypothetical protein G7054_g8943 [Neopestalotiopsis clavispora]|nr:hypothetical protein G7054_g8943 [Neopestalotiopsis clavispora]